MRYIFDKLIFCFVLILYCDHIYAQDYFKKYLDSEAHCNEYTNQVLITDQGYLLLNNMSCDTFPEFSTVYKLSGNGRVIETSSFEEIEMNIYSAHIHNNNLFLAGINNGINPESQILILETSILDGNVNLDTAKLTEIDLTEESDGFQINPIGSVHFGQSKVVYGQFRALPDQKVRSFFLWLNEDNSKDTTIIFDSGYDWSVISDATVDENGNLVVLIETINIIEHITHHFRIIHKYNSGKEKIFEWIAPVFHADQGIASIATLSPETVVMEYVDEEDEDTHAIFAVGGDGIIKWRWSFESESSYTNYRISDLISSQDGGVICTGTYRNLDEDILFTVLLLKFDGQGNLLWQRRFLDQEELIETNSEIAKVIITQSVVENENGDIAIAGRVIHDYWLPVDNSDLFFMVVDSNGCLSDGCGLVQDITELEEFLNPLKTWTEGYSNQSSWSFRYKFDTVPRDIDGRTHFELLRANSEFSENWGTTGDWWSYEDGRVYRHNKIIYDFNIVKEDTFHMGIFDFLVLKVDTISLLNGDLKKRWTLEPLEGDSPDNVVWVEGIGNLDGLYANSHPWSADWDYSTVLCVNWANNIVYDNPIKEGCWIMTTSTTEDREEDISVVPNPARDEITIVGLVKEIESVRVYNYMGNLVFLGKNDQILLSHLPSGYYFVRIQFNDMGVKTIGFIKN